MPDVIPVPIAVADGVTARLHSVDVSGLTDAIAAAAKKLCTCLDRIELEQATASSVSYSGPISDAGDKVNEALETAAKIWRALPTPGPKPKLPPAKTVLKAWISAQVNTKLKDAMNDLVAFANKGVGAAGGWLQQLPIPKEVKDLIKECPVQCHNDVVEVTAKATVSVIGLNAHVTLTLRFRYFLTQLEVVDQAKKAAKELDDAAKALRELGVPVPKLPPGVRDWFDDFFGDGIVSPAHPGGIRPLAGQSVLAPRGPADARRVMRVAGEMPPEIVASQYSGDWRVGLPPGARPRTATPPCPGCAD